MVNVNIELSGFTEGVVDNMIKRGYAKTKTEAVRLALYQFAQTQNISEEEIFTKLTDKTLDGVQSEKIKTRKFQPSELD